MAICYMKYKLERTFSDGVQFYVPKMELFLIYPGCRYALPWAMRALGLQPVTTLKKS